MQKRHALRRWQNDRDEARRLQSSGNSRTVRKGVDLQHPFSSESCRSSTVDHDEERTLESPSKRQEVLEVMKKTEWNEAKGREEERNSVGITINSKFSFAAGFPALDESLANSLHKTATAP